MIPLTILLAAVVPKISQAQNTVPLLWFYSQIQAGTCLAYSPDGSILAVGGVGVVQLRDASTGKILRCIPSAENVELNTITFSPDGMSLAVGGRAHYHSLGASVGLIELWDVASGMLKGDFASDPIHEVNSLAFSPDGTLLADAGNVIGEPYSSYVKVWKVSDGSTSNYLSTTSTSLYSVAFSPDGSKLVDAGRNLNSTTHQYEGVIELWNLANSKLIYDFPTLANMGVKSVAFSRNGVTIAAGGQAYNSATSMNRGVLELWNASTGKLTRSIDTGIAETGSAGLSSIAFSPDGSELASAGNSLNGSYSGYLQLWNASSGAKIASLSTAANFSANGVAFSPDGSTLADCGQSQNTYSGYGAVIEKWSVSTHASISASNQYSLDNYNGVAFSGDGQSIAVAGGTFVNGSAGQKYIAGVLNLWDARAGHFTASLPTSATNLYTVAYSPDGTKLACGGVETDSTSGTSHGVVEFWSTVSHKLLSTLPTSAVTVYCLAFSPDGKSVAVGGGNPGYQQGVVELWNIKTASLVASLKTANNLSVNSVAFSPNGSLLAVGGSGSTSGNAHSYPLELWSTSTASLLRTIPTVNSTVSSLSFSPDGTALSDCGMTSTGSSGWLESWSIPSGASRTKVNLFLPATSLAISPQGNVLFVGTGASLAAAAPINSYQLVSANMPIQALAVSPYGGPLAFTYAYSFGVLSNSYFLDPVIKLSVNPGAVEGGLDSVGTVTLKNPAPIGGVEVNLISDSNLASPQRLIVVPSGSTSATFPIQTMSVASNITVNIYASIGSSAQSTPLTLTTPSLASVTLSPSVVVGGDATTGEVTLGVPAPGGGAVVSLTSSSSLISLPSSIVIFWEQSLITFDVSTLSVTTPTTVAITATYNGTSQVGYLTLNPPGIASVSITPATSGIAVGTVTLDRPAPAGGAVVKLTSNNAALTVPRSFTILAGQKVGTFAIVVKAVSKPTSVTVTAMFGQASKAATLTLLPPFVDSLSLSPAQVVGGLSAVGTVTLSSVAPAGGIKVDLATNSAVATIPTTVTVLAGRKTAAFSARTRAVAADLAVGLSANFGGSSKAGTLKVLAPKLKSLTLNPTQLKGGKNSTGTVTISSAAPSGGLTVALTSSLSNASVPTTVKVLPGKITVTFVVKTKATTVKTQATITGALAGASKSAVLTID